MRVFAPGKVALVHERGRIDDDSAKGREIAELRDRRGIGDRLGLQAERRGRARKQGQADEGGQGCSTDIHGNSPVVGTKGGR
jgi:hypothetical protein